MKTVTETYTREELLTLIDSMEVVVEVGREAVMFAKRDLVRHKAFLGVNQTTLEHQKRLLAEIEEDEVLSKDPDKDCVTCKHGSAGDDSCRKSWLPSPAPMSVFVKECLGKTYPDASGHYEYNNWKPIEEEGS